MQCPTLPNSLTLTPSSALGEGLRATLAALLPSWEKGVGDQGRLKVVHRVWNIDFLRQLICNNDYLFLSYRVLPLIG